MQQKQFNNNEKSYEWSREGQTNLWKQDKNII